MLIQILCEFTRFFKLLIVVKNRHVPDTFDVKQKNRNHETIATDFTLNRQQRSLVNWAACKAVPVYKMGFSPSKNEHYQLVIVDTTAAPALYIVGQQYSCSLCSSLKYTDSQWRCSHIFHTTGEINTGNRRKVPCTVSVWFTQLWSNILSFENSLF